MVEYDIFLSYKSEDYESAKKVYEFLLSHGYDVFFAEPELRKIGNSIYGKIIDDALESAEHLIIFATQAKFITSSYVEEEWRIFVEEKRAGRKKGNIITILDGIDISSLPLALRHVQSFQPSEYDKILDFLPKKPKSPVLETFGQELNYILSDETITENIYNEFKEVYSTTCSNDLVSQIKYKIKGIINDIEKDGRQLKKSEFISIIQELVKDNINQKEIYGYNLASEIILKHCEATSARVGGILFKLYYSGNDIKLPTDTFKISSNLNMLYSSMYYIKDENSFESFIPENLIEKIQDSAITPILPYLIALMPLMPFIMLIKIINRNNKYISLAQIQDIYKKYDTDTNITRNIKVDLQMMIDSNNEIKMQISEVVKSFCNNCKSSLFKIGVSL